jgi:ABC-type polysaccharide/polyol phosphate transport system ATPase subunit
MLELGMGFDPEFSARENVFMNGALYGHSPAHMATIYNEIMDFAEHWDFENVPLKNFSSGMQARLGFAVATAVKPEIILLDEVLGVGDFRFVKKCENLISEILSGETTVLIVSHDVNTVIRMCTRAIVINKGELVYAGDPAEACKAYEDVHG